ncbi:ATP-binding protein [Actinoplanes sp. NPDC049265]|uniref:ATP-binding protein n=1 Tax=Actinoplanes sp. NPDC049265 TaxID=3363902 RepID=UPI0037147AC0
MDLRLAFSHGADCAALRSRARDALGHSAGPELVDDALLVITELVENVVQHTGNGGELTVRRRDGALRIEVADTSPHQPQVYGPDPRRIRGRGLMVVAAVSREWGTRAHDDGKVVWADLPLAGLPGPARAPDAIR